jgi:DNA-binding transcriptional MerR regulator
MGRAFGLLLVALESFKSLQGQAMAVSIPQDVQGYRIGEAAALSGVSSANIRYYEKEKLIPQRGMGANSYRMYSESGIHQLRFVRMLRGMDMSLAEVRTLLGLDLRRKADCDTARDTLDEHIEHVHTRLAELRQLEKQLKALRNSCDGRDKHCHIIEALHAQADAPLGAVPRARKSTRHV